MTAQVEASRLGDRIAEVCCVFVMNGFQVLDCFIRINLMLNVCGVCINARHLHTVRAWCANRGQAVRSLADSLGCNTSQPWDVFAELLRNVHAQRYAFTLL